MAGVPPDEGEAAIEAVSEPNVHGEWGPITGNGGGPNKVPLRKENYHLGHSNSAKSSLILGIDFMEAQGMVLDAGKREVTLRGGKAIKLLGSPGKGMAKKEYKVGQYEARQVTIVTGEAPGGQYVADGPWVDPGIIETDQKGEANNYCHQGL